MSGRLGWSHKGRFKDVPDVELSGRVGWSHRVDSSNYLPGVIVTGFPGSNCFLRRSFTETKNPRMYLPGVEDFFGRYGGVVDIDPRLLQTLIFLRRLIQECNLCPIKVKE